MKKHTQYYPESKKKEYDALFENDKESDEEYNKKCTKY